VSYRTSVTNPILFVVEAFNLTAGQRLTGVAAFMRDNAIAVSRPRPEVAWLTFVGEHDLTTTAETTRLLERLVADNSIVVADLSSVTFMDSQLLACLVAASRHAIQVGHEFRLYVRDNRSVTVVLEATGLHEHFSVFVKETDALGD
jgi:anti-anti-sigma factor